MDILETIKNLTNNLWGKYGNPLRGYKKTQDDVHMTYYVGHLMEDLGHRWVAPERIKGDCENRAYFSERAVHDAFLAGQLLTKTNNKNMRAGVIAELKSELHDAIDNMKI